MSKRILFLVALVSMMALSACAPAGTEPQAGEGSATLPGCPPGKESDTGADCAANAQPPAANPNPDAPVSSDGSLSLPATLAPGATGGGEPGFAGGGEPVDPATGEEPPVVDRGAWLTYTDTTYGFTLAYPPDRVPAPLDAAALATLTPRPLAAVYFQSLDSFTSAVADMAPPELAVRVYANEGDRPLAEWLAGAGLMASGSAPEAYGGEDGAAGGLRACLAIEIAPNCFIYLPGDGVVYELTPLGPVGEEMAGTIRN